MVELPDGTTVLTPTGDRGVALERCLYYLERQTVKPDQWLVVDDGSVKTASKLETKLPIQIINRTFDKKKANSFITNIREAIPYIKFNNIIIFEDDDWYHPTYIDRTLQRLREVAICGQPNAVYYNIKFRRYRINGNTWRASFCETAFKSRLLPKLKKLCRPGSSAFLDSRLWQHCVKNKLPFRLYQDARLCIGIKGLPGRTGIGIGHRRDRDWETKLF